MNLSLILALILAAIRGLGGAGVAGYNKGKTDAERVAKLKMDEHLVEDREAERTATEAASRHKDELLVEYATYGMNSQLFVQQYQLYLPDREELRRELENTLRTTEPEDGETSP